MKSVMKSIQNSLTENKFVVKPSPERVKKHDSEAIYLER